MALTAADRELLERLPRPPADEQAPADRWLAAAQARWEARAAAGQPVADGLGDDLAAIAAIRRDGLDRAWRALCPARYWSACVDELDDDAKRHAVDRWLAAPGANLLLVGAGGRGKTFTALAAARARHDAGWTCAFWPLGRWCSSLSAYGTDPAYQAAAAAGVLVLDDLGTAVLNTRETARLYDLVNDRYLEQAPIVATSNLSPGDGRLAQAIGQRVYDRLVEDAVAVALGGPDRRRKS